MPYQDDKSRDNRAVEWFEDPRCTDAAARVGNGRRGAFVTSRYALRRLLAPD